MHTIIEMYLQIYSSVLRSRAHAPRTARNSLVATNVTVVLTGTDWMLISQLALVNILWGGGRVGCGGVGEVRDYRGFVFYLWRKIARAPY